MFDLILQIDIQRVFRSGLLHPQPRVSIYWNYRSSGFDKFNLFYIYWEIYHKLPYLVSSLIQYEYLRYYPCFGNMIWCVPLHTIMPSTGHTSRFHWLDLITAPFFSMQWLWLLTFGCVAVFLFIYFSCLILFTSLKPAQLYSCDFYFTQNMFVITVLIYESRFYACRDPQMDLNSTFFMIVWTVSFGFALTSTLKDFLLFRYVAIMNAIFSAQRSMVLNVAFCIFQLFML